MTQLSRTTNDERRTTILLAALLVVIGLFYLLTLRDGHQAGDFAMLVQHAVNLVEGRPYTETAYLPNPNTAAIGGLTAYPPGVPVLVAPLYAVFGLDFTVMKVLMALCLLGSVWLVALLARRALPPPYVLLVMTFVGFQPYFWEIKDDVLSDVPFLLFALLSLWLIGRYEKNPSAWVLGVITGLAMFAATMMRTVGLALVISLFLYDLVHHRRWWPSRLFWIPAGVFVVGMVLQGILLPVEGNASYGDAFREQVSDPLDLVIIALDYAHRYLHGSFTNTLLANDYSTPFRYLVALFVLGTAALGYLWRVWRQLTVVEVFTVVYTGVMLVWPYQMIRYMIPVYVLLFLYCVIGLYRVRTVLPERWGLVAVAVVTLAVWSTYAMRYTTRDFQVVPQDVVRAPSQELYRYVEANTAEDAVFICRVPNVLALYTNRTATVPLEPDELPRYTEVEAEAVFDYIEDMGVDYLVTGPRGPYFHGEILPLWHLARDYPERLDLVFNNDEYEMYRIKAPDPVPDPVTAQSSSPG